MAELSNRIELRELDAQLETIEGQCRDLIDRRHQLDEETSQLRQGRVSICDRLSGPVTDATRLEAALASIDTEVDARALAMVEVHDALRSRDQELQGLIGLIDSQLARHADVMERAAELPNGTEVVLHLSTSIEDLNQQRHRALSLVGLLEPSTRQPPTEAVDTTRWVERGIISVDVAEVPPETDIGATDFRKVSEAEMRAGLTLLQEMLPVIHNGEGNSSEYWAAADHKLNLPYRDGYQRVYDAFFGQEAIRVERDGNLFTVINGRHRLYLAQQMGITALPMNVVERRAGG